MLPILLLLFCEHTEINKREQETLLKEKNNLSHIYNNFRYNKRFYLKDNLQFEITCDL